MALAALAIAIALPNRRLAPLALAGLGTLFALDEVGTSGPQGGPVVRIAAVTSMILVGTGWWSGVARESLAGDRR